jgi:hypothetical protein
MVALQADRFVEGLSIETLLDDEAFLAAKKAAEELHSPSEFYWEGKLAAERDRAVRAERRRLEDRIRKDRYALLRAWTAVFF